MNFAEGESLREREAGMYRLGYAYGAWVVREDVLGLGPVCTLTYFREKPTAADLRERYGERFLHLAEAVPKFARNDDGSSDLEVLSDAAD